MAGDDQLVQWLRERVRRLEEELEIMRRLLSEVEQKVAGGEEVIPSGEDLDTLPWRAYGSGRGEWVYADQFPAPLLEKLSREREVEVGGYLYRLKEGLNKRFVARYPAKASSKKSSQG